MYGTTKIIQALEPINVSKIATYTCWLYDNKAKAYQEDINAEQKEINKRLINIAEEAKKYSKDSEEYYNKVINSIKLFIESDPEHEDIYRALELANRVQDNTNAIQAINISLRGYSFEVKTEEEYEEAKERGELEENTIYFCVED